MFLIDSNVIVAGIFEDHDHHREARAFFAADRLPAILIAAHSIAEAYVTLTKRGGPKPIMLDGARARDAVRSVEARARIASMTAVQTIKAIDAFVALGIGARLYDFLIGQTGVVHGAETIVTFNLRHMRSLFPQVPVLSPVEYLRKMA